MADDLIERLQHVGLRPDLYARRPNDLAQAAGEAVGEIERLRRERDEALRGIRALGEALDECNERNRLQEEALIELEQGEDR